MEISILFVCLNTSSAALSQWSEYNAAIYTSASRNRVIEITYFTEGSPHATRLHAATLALGFLVDRIFKYSPRYRLEIFWSRGNIRRIIYRGGHARAICVEQRGTPLARLGKRFAGASRPNSGDSSLPSVRDPWIRNDSRVSTAACGNLSGIFALSSAGRPSLRRAGNFRGRLSWKLPVIFRRKPWKGSPRETNFSASGEGIRHRAGCNFRSRASERRSGRRRPIVRQGVEFSRTEGCDARKLAFRP